MELSIYSIFDMGSKAYAQPFYTVNDGMAIRMFSDNVNSKEENMINKHPDQFVLFKIGEFNDQTGKIESFEKPVNLGLAQTYKVEQYTKEEFEVDMSTVEAYLTKIMDHLEIEHNSSLKKEFIKGV